MTLPELGVKRPIFTIVVFFIIFLVGLISLYNLPVELLPDFSFPYISVITSYEGTGPEEIESSITKLIEGAVSTIPNVKKVYSTSAEGLSIVGLEFEWETDLDNAANDIRDSLDQISAYLPAEADKPIIQKMSTATIPVMMIGVRAKESYPKLSKIVEDKVTDVLKQVDGVGNSIAFGGLIREIRIDLNQARINSYNISLDTIINKIRANNVFLPGGEIQTGNSEYILRVPAEYRNIREIENITVGFSRGIPVYLKDVASVMDSFKEDNMIVRVNGDPGMMVIVQKQSKANTVKVAQKINEKLEKIRKTLPDDVKLDTSLDTSKFIKDSINTLTSSIGWGFIFVVLVVFLFLIDWRGSTVISVTIPFSLISSFIILFFMGFTINIMSLSSLAIAIGMVVDNAIVVTENIYRLRFEKNLDIKTSAIKGANEVVAPVLASTLTTVVIYIPIFFVTGIVNIMFRELSISIITVLMASYLVSIFLTPMLCSLLFGQKPVHPLLIEAERINNDLMEKIKLFYKKTLIISLKHKRFVVFSSIGIFLLSLIILALFVGKEFSPKEDQGFLNGSIELESTTRIEETDKVMARIEALIEKNVPEKEMVLVRSGKSPGGRAAASGREEGANIGFIMMRMVSKNKRDRSADDVLEWLNKELKKIPGIKSASLSTDMGGGGFGSGKPIIIEIYGYDLDTTMAFAKTVQKVLASIKGTDNIVISRKTGKPEIQIQINKQKVNDLDLSLSQIANTIKNSFAGVTTSQYREGGDEYDIFVRLQKSDRQNLDYVKNILIRTPSGKSVSVGNLADFVVKVGPKSITRKQRERYLTVECEIFKRKLSDIKNEFDKKMKQVAVPSGVRYQMTGSAEDMQETFRILFQVLLLGITLVYLIMAAQFESFRDPFIIMFSVPFAIVGVAWGLFLTGLTLNMNSLTGIVMLVGIVVNNAIILIDKINQLRREENHGLMDAILEGCTIRLRPIFMTTFTTIFGLLPMAFATGEGSESWVSLGVSILSGLLVSTLITLVLIPVGYMIFEQRKCKEKSIQIKAC